MKERLMLYAKEVRDSAARLPPGIEREALLRKARQADATAQDGEVNNFAALRPPK